MAELRSKETEAKYLVWSPEQIDRVLDGLTASGYELVERGRATHVDRYFDTDDWSVLKAGWACRSRTRGEHSRLMLKSLGNKDGEVFHREEIEQPMAGQVLGQITRGQGCSELFQVESDRTIYDVRAPGDESPAVEIDLDRTCIHAEKLHHKAMGRIEFMEVEIEGDGRCVKKLAQLLRHEAALVPSQMSKFERGIQATGIQPTFGAGVTGLDKPALESPIIDLIYWYLDQQFQALQFQRPRAWEGLDPEGVHRMRVATRRLRAVLRAFRKLLPAIAWDEIEPELKWLAAQLGHARDADVCEMGVDRYRAALHGLPVSVLAPYEARMRVTTLQAHAALVETLASPRYSTLCDALAAFLEKREARKKACSTRIVDCDQNYIDKVLAKTLRRADRAAENPTARRIHRLRIQAKRLRYLLEFFDTVNPERWQPTILALEDFQDIIGEHQDAVTAIDRLEEYMATVEDKVELQAMEQLVRYEEDRKIARRAEAWQEWLRFRDTLD